MISGKLWSKKKQRDKRKAKERRNVSEKRKRGQRERERREKVHASSCCSLYLALDHRPLFGLVSVCYNVGLKFLELAMAFAGTTQKCMACTKTVYLVDKLAADSRIYHKTCFRCHHCRGTLKLSNFCSFEGVLYCRPHYDQLFKRTGSLDKSFEGTPKILKPEKTVDPENASKVSSFFAGTRDKCVGCAKTVYPIEKVTVNGSAYHRSCFKCTYGGCTISPSNYIAHEGRLYCKHHHIQLVKEKGNYSQLEVESEKEQLSFPAASIEVAAES